MRNLGATIPESSTCSQFNDEFSECNVQTMCSLCISTGTCEFDVMSLSCEMKNALSGNDSETTYCSSNDTVCSGCNATAADPICTGEDGTCICQSLCSVIEPLDTICTSIEGSIIPFIGTAVVMLCLASCVYFVMVKYRTRYESEQLRMRQPQLALNLIGWRDTVHLGACSYIIKKAERIDPTGSVKSIAVDEGELRVSLATSPTYSDIEPPRSSRTPDAESSPHPNNFTGECDFNTKHHNLSR
ncbi:hypothetical protein PHMEG_000383 [Phytophthora megakarya]|uniref:Uncharacterized protein n=1 Tax=Phytophthora megakarya TaxID=4795 RepID=A0A225X5M1_9STRA|nr:hypothetical protein PHMEG_000383 [Phytophthora megakarya]